MEKQILYIDSDMASYILVSEILRNCNVKITHCKCGTSAILLFKKYPSFDLIITEIRLPKANGFTVLNEIRRIKQDIPIIAQTASVLDNMEKRCLEAGFNEFMAKPFDLQFFKMSIYSYLEGI
ncbi:MAG: response regulator [Bacteroidales bacterium]|nr:response regulator [Bacteroidales bacterium]